MSLPALSPPIDAGAKPDPAQGAPVPHESFHKDGTLWARGQTLDGMPTGYWEWFRKSGTRMRSGWFDHGEQTGAWTTYDQAGAVYKITNVRPRLDTAAPGKLTKNKAKSNASH